MRILYVDDDIEDIEIFQEAINSVDSSIQYLTARSATDALQLLHRSSDLPNHIVMDINMPGMDGKICLSEIRKEKKYDPINVVIYSTNCFPEDIEHIQSMGARFVRKANSFTDLCSMIRTLASK